MIFATVPLAMLFAASAFTVGAPRGGGRSLAGEGQLLCGRRRCVLLEDASRQGASATTASAMASLSWINPTRWGSQQLSMVDRLSPRDWLRMYRTLGLPAEASRDQVQRATARLRRKYVENEPALEKVEAANLWIMTRLVSQKEEQVRQRQQANRLRELGDSPRRLLNKYVLGFLPPSIRQMIEAPDMPHFRRASGLCGLFALLGLCVPTQATNFVGLAAASAMGLIYQRGRPEPVKDEMGNVGEVRQINFKEMGGTIGVVALAAALGCGLSYLFVQFTDAPIQAAFCASTCFFFWMAALFFKVYQVFEP